MSPTSAALPYPASAKLWLALFLILPIGYCLYYAPFGINETDGGFLSGLAWQLLNGKKLYADIIYVRPPMPVWLRMAELMLLPENWQVLGERWIFYLKIALYSWLGAEILARDAQKWKLATFGFLISAHSYPPMAWHTVDGILFSVLAAYFLNKNRVWSAVLAGIALCAAVLCKQSFYPLILIFPVFLFWTKTLHTRPALWFGAAFLGVNGLFLTYLWKNSLLQGFFQMTAGASEGGQAFEHGILDYFRITPELALPSLALLALIFLPFFQKRLSSRSKYLIWIFWIAMLALSFAAVTWRRQEHTVPFAQSRMLFWLAAGFLGSALYYKRSNGPIDPKIPAFALLLGISWCASVSWGYALPILFSTPWVWAVLQFDLKLKSESRLNSYSPLVALALVLFCFRVGYEFVYRDGRRSEMKENMGLIFPKLSGIYSDRETAQLYSELKTLSERYGPGFKTLPAFPQANFLTNTYPPLPLDWVVNRETNGANQLTYNNLETKRPFLFIQKSYKDKIGQDPQLEVTRQIMRMGKLLEETPNFLIYQYPSAQ